MRVIRCVAKPADALPARWHDDILAAGGRVDDHQRVSKLAQPHVITQTIRTSAVDDLAHGFAGVSSVCWSNRATHPARVSRIDAALSGAVDAALVAPVRRLAFVNLDVSIGEQRGADGETLILVIAGDVVAPGVRRVERPVALVGVVSFSDEVSGVKRARRILPPDSLVHMKIPLATGRSRAGVGT